MVVGNFQFTNAAIEELFTTCTQQHNVESHDFFGNFYASIVEKYPFFSSRDLRNIQKAVDARIIDFDLPEVWWDNPNDFFTKPYENKLVILKDLMQQNMKGSSFSDLRLYEALSYIENAVRINETGLQRSIQERAKELYIQREAQEVLAKGAVND